MTDKIDYMTLQQKLLDASIPEEDLRPYLRVDPGGSGPFDPRVTMNPETVAIPEAMAGIESSLAWGNAIAKQRRRDVLLERIRRGDRAPLIVSEGDSWFQFPFMIRDVIDHLGDDFKTCSLGAAGDTARNMVFGRSEYLKALNEFGNDVQAFLFSAAGNDVIGETQDGRPALLGLLKTGVSSPDPSMHIDQMALAQTLNFLKDAYGRVISTIRAIPGMGRLPIIIHGYDYAIPGSQTDPRRPSWATPDKWLGGPMINDCRIMDGALQQAVVRRLIDALYDMLFSLAGNSAQTRVYVVDARGALPRREDWADEIHGTDAGFARVAARFKAVIDGAL